MSFTLPVSAVRPLNKLSGSSSNTRLQKPHKIGYPNGWKTGPTQEWYDSQPSKRFTHLQYRKEREAPFYHEFIVAELENKTVCRFDRRGDVQTRANAFTLDGITAEDTAHVISPIEDHYADINNKSDQLLRIHFPKGQDLLTILAICYGVQKDDAASAYTLTKYNCYFLSWTIITATARRTVDWALLGKETSRWEDLVETTIKGLSSDSTPMSRLKAGVRTALTLARKSDAANADTIPFIGSSYLISTLRQALVNTRQDIQKSLGDLILRTRVEPAIRTISKISSQTAAQEAARSHAGQAARDAAMEAVIESMWRNILSSENGGQLWEDQCKTAESCVWQAANAAASADAEPEPETPGEEDTGPKNWERAWDAAWAESWNSESSNEGARSNSTSDDSARDDISNRAKSAWRQAWIDAREANEQYVDLVSNGVAEYVNKNLPESMPEVLKIDTSAQSKLRAVFQSFEPDKTNTELQTYIQKRIGEHCQRLANMGMVQHLASRAEIEDTMGRVWVSTASLD